jgi:very-short-patch-repair endonuclease
VTSVARTLLDLAAILPPKLVQRAYEEAARLGVLETEEVHELLARSKGKRGVRVLRAIAEIDPGFASRLKFELERRFADLIRDSDLPMYEPNARVCGYEVDALWLDARLIVELDGRSFHTDAFSAERDDTKTVRLRLAGYEVLRLTYAMIERRPDWVLEVVRTMRARGLAANAEPEARAL